MKNCNQCGKCCINYSDGGLTATQAEIDFWDSCRPEIYAYVHDGKIWMDPITGEQLTRCPWLRQIDGEEKYTCDIYFDRPDDCKHYPITLDQMVKDDCEMLEARDLIHPKKAQKKLDILMMDSRPSN